MPLVSAHLVLALRRIDTNELCQVVYQLSVDFALTYSSLMLTMKLENIKIPKIERVQLLDRFSVRQLTGTLYVTATHVIFISTDKTTELWVLHGYIGPVERGQLSAMGCLLTIKCKHFLTLSFLISRDRDCQDLFETLQLCSQSVNLEEVFAFSYAPNEKKNEYDWFQLDWSVEFKRQGIDDKWKVVDVNSEYKCCDTYPQTLAIPAAATTQMLIASSQFRSRCRLPVLTYYHKGSKASICRCAQPLTGFRARCIEDETLMEMIAKANPHCNILYLVDTRPRVNAMVNKVQGKGFEDEKNYANMRFQFFDIENIHVMRSSLQKLLDTLHQQRSVSDYWKGVESSGWLRHIRAILECGIFLADSIQRGVSCVVHCSDGWDRTAQTVSVAQILLDPYFRTIDGFRLLIEKDWLGFGHKFSDRCGHAGTPSEEFSKEVSPIFTQFLDATWQLMRQAPRAFQFRERYLIHIHNHAYSCQFGTFLGNCDKDRKDLRLSERTQSLWTHLEKKRDGYVNPLYQSNMTENSLLADMRPQAIRIWTGLYNQFDEGLFARENIHDIGVAALEHVGVLEAHLASLQTRIAELKTSIGQSAHMADSGHDSASSHHNDTPKISKTVRHSDSGVFEASNSLIVEEPQLNSVAVKWVLARNVAECAACMVKFSSSDRKLHCYKCGKIYCRRCLLTTSEARLCTFCSFKDKSDTANN